MIRVQCPTCGSRYKTEDRFAGMTTKCPNCGAGIAVPKDSGEPKTDSSRPTTLIIPRAPGPDGFAVASLVCGVLGLLIPFVPYVAAFGFIPAVTGTIAGIISTSTAVKAKRSRCLAAAGLILSVLALIWVPLYVFLIERAGQ